MNASEAERRRKYGNNGAFPGIHNVVKRARKKKEANVNLRSHE